MAGAIESQIRLGPSDLLGIGQHERPLLKVMMGGPFESFDLNLRTPDIDELTSMMNAYAVRELAVATQNALRLHGLVKAHEGDATLWVPHTDTAFQIGPDEEGQAWLFPVVLNTGNMQPAFFLSGARFPQDPDLVTAESAAPFGSVPHERVFEVADQLRRSVPFVR